MPTEILALLFWAAWALILYTYLIFPILLSFLARLLGKTSRPATDGETVLPRVAMVVAAYNEAGILPDKLANTWNIDYPADRFRLLIGSDGSDDGTAEILRTCNDVRLNAYLFQERRGKISVLNDLMQRADADVVVFSDANTMFAPDAVRKLVRHFRNPAIGCVSGELGLEQEGGVSGEGLYWKYESWIKRNESRLGFLIGCNGGIFALRRELYTPLPSGTVVEDFVLSMRVLECGHRVVFEPEARATEPPCPSARAEMVRKIRIGAGNFQALGLTSALLHPRYGLCAFAYWGHKVLRWLVPLFLLMAVTTNLLLVCTPTAGTNLSSWMGLAFPGSLHYTILLACQLLGVAVAVWAYHAAPGRELPRWTRPISYFYLMNYALLCGLWRFLIGGQQVTWDRLSR